MKISLENLGDVLLSCTWMMRLDESQNEPALCSEKEKGEVYKVTLEGKNFLQWLEEVRGRGVMWRGFLLADVRYEVVVCFGAWCLSRAWL